MPKSCSATIMDLQGTFGPSPFVKKIRNKNEFAIHCGLSHLNIVKLLSTSEDKITYQISLELERGIADLFNLAFDPNYSKLLADVSSVSVLRWQKVFGDVVAGLAYLHSVGIAHLDMKAENVILSQQHNWQIIDFGGSLRMQDGKCACPKGNFTFEFAAPELLCGGMIDGAAADMWSLGVMMVVVFTETLLFEYLDSRNLVCLQSDGSYQVIPCLPKEVSSIESCLRQTTTLELFDFICLDPAKRVTASHCLSKLRTLTC